MHIHSIHYIGIHYEFILRTSSTHAYGIHIVRVHGHVNETDRELDDKFEKYAYYARGNNKLYIIFTHRVKLRDCTAWNTVRMYEENLQRTSAYIIVYLLYTCNVLSSCIIICYAVLFITYKNTHGVILLTCIADSAIQVL